MLKNLIKNCSFFALISFVIFLMSGCSVNPSAFNNEDLSLNIDSTNALINSNIEPLTGPLTIEEAVARAIKYNLEHRVSRYEQSISLGVLDLSQYDMIPDILRSAGYSSSTRDRPPNGSLGGSSRQSSWENSLDLSWNLLDFGNSYYIARQNADRVMVSMAQRRRVMHLLMADVESAYWRSASAQLLLPEVFVIEAELVLAIERAKVVLANNLCCALANKRHLRELLSAKESLADVKESLVSAPIELANLINLPQGTPMTLADVTIDFDLSEPLELDLSSLELAALYYNAGLEAERYELRIAALEARRSIMELLPSVNFTWGIRQSSDSSLVNQNWQESAIAINANLLNLFRYDDVRQLGQARKELQELRLAALHMSIIAQVHLSRLRVENAIEKLRTATLIAEVDHSIEEFVRFGSQAGTINDAEVIVSQVTAVVSVLRQYAALADLYYAERRLESTLGLEPIFSDIETASLSDLTRSVIQSRADWQSGLAVERALHSISHADSEDKAAVEISSDQFIMEDF
jgi:outer membrane protein TolC